MPKHNGCAVCGSMRDEVLISTPDMRHHTSYALCSECRALDNVALKAKLDAARTSMKAREVSNG